MANDSSPLVVSWPAIRNVPHCATMLWSGSVFPCLSVPTSMWPSRSVPGSLEARRSLTIASIVSSMNLAFAMKRRWAPRRSLIWTGSIRWRLRLSSSESIIAWTNGCWVSR
jgi:hypothetical protein